MANPEQIEILYQGVEKWNQWRESNSVETPDLSEADLRRAYLRGAYLRGADLHAAKLMGANLIGADLNGTYLGWADFSRADLGGAKLIEANLIEADLGEADLRGADLSKAYLRRVDLRGANLSGATHRGAYLSGTNLIGANLNGADLTGALFESTILGDNDLSTARGVDAVIHMGPSTIGIDTIYNSGGKIPDVFLRGCGVPENFITFAKSLVNSPIEFYSCFISYSSRNQDFAERLYTDLQSKGVRCWYAPEDLKIGERFRRRIDESIRTHEKLLLVLSKDSVESQWVEKEVETAMDREREQARESVVLFPIKLDDAILDEKSGWAADIRRTRHIGDFRGWKNHDEYRKSFDRLLRDLRSESKSQE